MIATYKHKNTEMKNKNNVLNHIKMRRGYMTRRRKHLIKNNQFHIIYKIKIKINLFTFCARSFDMFIANIFLQNLCSVCAVRSQSRLRAILITRPKRILKKK